ncbi:extracellular solute-binding protein [bacterium]|nr:extracellular solute-binding protein [bacterium]
MSEQMSNTSTNTITAQPGMGADAAKATVNSRPIFQASPAGGVVATLQPGQTGFAGDIRDESNRMNGLAVQTTLTNMPEVANEEEPSQPERNYISRSIFRSKSTTTPAAATVIDEASVMTPVETELGQQTEATAGSLGAAVMMSQAASKSGKIQQVAAPKSVRNLRVGAEKKEKKQYNWLLWAVVGALVLMFLGMIIYYWYNRKVNTRQAIEPEITETTILTYWGLWEPTVTFTQVLKDFERQNEGITVKYTKKNIDGYYQQLSEALESNNGPDVFRYHASWRGMLDKGAHLDGGAEVASYADFYPVVGDQMKNANGQYQGVPLMYDSLGLLYNKDIFAEANLEVPKTWYEFAATAIALTDKDSDGYIERAGAAMGLADNVDFFSDIVGLLAMQNGVNWEGEIDTNTLNEVLKFYTSFYTDPARRVWDETFEESTVEFARGNVAMIIAPSWRIHDILQINPNLNIGVASVPQLDLANTIEWATYWVEGVNADSPSKTAAWKLLQYLSQNDVLEQLNQEQSNTRAFGEIYPRKSMSDKLTLDNYARPYVINANRAKNYALNDLTFDGALNDTNKENLAKVIRIITMEPDRFNTKTIQDFIESLKENEALYGY